MASRSVAAVVLALALASLPVPAHELHAEVGAGAATVVTLRYADGLPFGGEAYELFADGAGQPTLRGRSDAQGRIVFIADVPGRWRLRAFSDDGHGVDMLVEAGAARPAEGPAAGGQGTPGRGTLALFGLSLLLGGFGLLQLLQRRRGG